MLPLIRGQWPLISKLLVGLILGIPTLPWRKLHREIPLNATFLPSPNVPPMISTLCPCLAQVGITHQPYPGCLSQSHSTLIQLGKVLRCNDKHHWHQIMGWFPLSPIFPQRSQGLVGTLPSQTPYAPPHPWPQVRRCCHRSTVNLWVLMVMKVLELVILLGQIYIIVRGMHQIPMHIRPAMGQVQGVYHPQIPIIPGSLVVFLR